MTMQHNEHNRNENSRVPLEEWLEFFDAIERMPSGEVLGLTWQLSYEAEKIRPKVYEEEQRSLTYAELTQSSVMYVSYDILNSYRHDDKRRR
jgi:hypothetical protein